MAWQVIPDHVPVAGCMCYGEGSWSSSLQNTQGVYVSKQDDQFGFLLFLFRKLQETQMSTTSKLEEAEHKVQTLQTGVIFFMLVKLMGKTDMGEVWSISRSPQAPLLSVAVVSPEEEGNPRSRMPVEPPVSPPWLLLVTHPHWAVNVEVGGSELHFILSTSHSFFLLFFQQTHLNHQTVKDWHFIWNNIRKRKTYFYPSEVKENRNNRPLKCKR